MKRFVIVGGGIIGLAAAWKLFLSNRDVSVTVLEKEGSVCRHQSGNNSGVLHAGLYYKPGSLKAILSVQGIREMVEFCATHGIAHEVCGKLVVATSPDEVPRLKALHERGRQNGLRDLRYLERQEMLEIEPRAGGLAALHVPEEGIVDYRGVCEVLVGLLKAQGCEVVTEALVTALHQETDGWRVVTSKGEYRADFLVNCAGLHCDRVGKLAGETPAMQIVPFRGEYYQLKSGKQHLVRNLIYPVPDPVFPFLGVHFTRLIHGGVEAGPNAVLAFSREGYHKTQVRVRDLCETLAFPGLWRFFGAHAGMCWEELKRSFSKKLFCASLQKLVPEIREDDLEEGGAGVRAQAMDRDGTLLQDFYMIRRENALHVFNAPSPAATASLAIGSEIVAQIAA